MLYIYLTCGRYELDFLFLLSPFDLEYSKRDKYVRYATTQVHSLDDADTEDKRKEDTFERVFHHI